MIVRTAIIGSKIVSAAFVAALSGAGTDGSATYGYDLDGRLGSVLYDNGTCVTYQYDANGNRTSQTNTLGGGPVTPTWGTGSWGCFSWTSP